MASTTLDQDYEPTKTYPVITMEEINKKIQNDGDKQRATNILTINKQLTDQLIHYAKLASRWTAANIWVRIIGHGISITCAILITIFSAVPSLNVPVGVDIFLGIFAAVETTIIELIARFLTSKRKVYYLSKNVQIRGMMNKAYYYINKAIEDGYITVDELSSFTKIITDDISQLKREDDAEYQNEKDVFMAQLKKIAAELAMKEFQKSTIRNFKNTELQKLNSKYQMNAQDAKDVASTSTSGSSLNMK